MNLDRLMALPQAVAAALTAHRWCAGLTDARSVNALSLLECLAGLNGIPDDRLQIIVATIAANAADTPKMLTVLRYLVDIDRDFSLCMAVGRNDFAGKRRQARQTAVTFFLHCSVTPADPRKVRPAP